MRKFILTLGVLLAIGSTADAGGRLFSRTRSVAVSRSVTVGGPTTAQAKAETQATTGVMRHVGPVSAGTVEGVGFSTVSPQAALDACCYSRSGLPILSQAVARGRAGWYATRVYAANVTHAVVSAPANVFRTLTGRGQTCSGPNCSR